MKNLIDLFSLQFFEFAKTKLVESEYEYFALDFDTWFTRNKKNSWTEPVDFWRDEFLKTKLQIAQRLHDEFVSTQNFKRVTNKL